MEINIPIFRAKKLDSDDYIIGYIVKSECDEDFLIRIEGEYHFIDPTTLSIHFPDMVDSQGNKIFASLQEDGRDGDILVIEDTDMEYIYKYNKGVFSLGNEMDLFNEYLRYVKVSIQE